MEKVSSSTALLDAARAHYAARHYTSVVALLHDVPRAQLLEVPEQGFMLADSARRVGGLPNLVELAADVVNEARKQADAHVLCDALNLYGVLLLEAGQPRAAQRTWSELVAVASEADNSQYVARASNNLGVAAILSMRLDEAIISFQRAVAAYVRLGYARGLAQSHHNLGIVFRELNHEQESYAHFQRALTWAYTADCLDDVARVEEELALLELYSGKDLQTASNTADSALQRYTELAQPAGVAQALRVVGVIALARGQMSEAEHALQRALLMAREHSLRLLEAETLLALGALGRKQQADVATLQKQARAIFREIDAERWGEQVQLRMDELIESST